MASDQGRRLARIAPGRLAYLLRWAGWHLATIASIMVPPIVLIRASDPENQPSFNSFLIVAAASVFVWLLLFDGWRSWKPGAGARLDPDRLNRKQVRLLAGALDEAYTAASLSNVLKFRLGVDLSAIAAANPDVRWPLAVVRHAAKEGWGARLLEVAQQSNPGGPSLAEFSLAASHGQPGPDAVALEKILRQGEQFHDPSDFIVKLAGLESRICRVSYLNEGRRSFGTGVLVGPDMVLTNYHVVEGIYSGTARTASVQCLFDFRLRADGVELAGTGYGLRKRGWDVEHSPYSQADLGKTNRHSDPDELDFALLRLSKRVGSLPIGLNPEPGAPKRGWVPFKAGSDPVAKGDPVFILQHPSGDSTKLAFGSAGEFNANGTRLRHSVNTLPGSSGAPCFNINLELVGIHQAGGIGETRIPHNQAIPIALIVDMVDQPKQVSEN